MSVVYRTKEEWLSEAMEHQKLQILEQVEAVGDSFARSFFEHVLENTAADAQEFFVELNCGSNFMRQHNKRLDSVHRRRYFVLMAMYHILRLSREEAVDGTHLQQYAEAAFAWTSWEKQLFLALKGIGPAWRMGRVFSEAFGAYVLDAGTGDTFSYAFFMQYLEHSYTCLLGGFTRYMTLERRLELAREEGTYGDKLDQSPGSGHRDFRPGHPGGGRGGQRKNRGAGGTHPSKSNG